MPHHLQATTALVQITCFLPLGLASPASLSVLDFVKIVNKVKVNKSGLAKVDRSIREITSAEGLLNHYEAVKARMNEKKNGWLNYNIKRIAWLDHYAKPEKVKGAIKLDSNENFALIGILSLA